ncbi:MAG: DUF983 domain-containing protein [Sphingobium sp.]
MVSQPDDRPLKDALLHGIAGRCPACGSAPLFARFLKPVQHCRACGQDWTHQQADDFPAYIVIFIVGHLLVPLVVSINMRFEPSLVAQMIGWPLATIVLSLAMIQPVKGAVIAWQWSRRMHGL